jgi:hypothetical protein
VAEGDLLLYLFDYSHAAAKTVSSFYIFFSTINKRIDEYQLL